MSDDLADFDERMMRLALEEAEACLDSGDVPVGSVIARDGDMLASAGNARERMQDPTAHAEVLTLREASDISDSWRLDGCTLYVTLEPCAMCAAAIAFARIRRLVFGAYDPKGGGVEHGARFFAQATCHHRPEVIGGVAEQRCQALLQAFFRARRPQL